ncbi:hypothetical protein LT493_44060 [Streptomyces tricolor]|nr:hypothetical protein [Streptomyces tricolor]
MVRLERSAEAERAKLAGLCGAEYDAQWQAWRRAAEAFQAAVTEQSDARACRGTSWSRP